MEKNPLKILNRLGKERVPFLFLISFDKSDIRVFPLPADSEKVLFQFPGASNSEVKTVSNNFVLSKEPPAFDIYRSKFDHIMSYLKRGEISLINLTQVSKITLNHSTGELFYAANALYKLHLPGEFTVFSPETFIRIKANTISSFPMKGTIDASLPDAENMILKDHKEIDEHRHMVAATTEDLKSVAENVQVKRFRYITHVKNAEKELLQVSSEVSGELPAGWQEQLGDILDKLLPAGSICGVPREKSLQVINEAEAYERGFYTGVMGIFDGENLDSAVMIRFVEEQGNELFYKSGGGITVHSIAEKEYQELIDKIYVPVY